MVASSIYKQISFVYYIKVVRKWTAIIVNYARYAYNAFKQCSKLKIAYYAQNYSNKNELHSCIIMLISVSYSTR